MASVSLWISFISLLSCTNARNWTIFAPLLSPLVISKENRSTGLLPQLFNETIEPFEDNFLVRPISDWFTDVAGIGSSLNVTAFDKGALKCLKNLLNTDPSGLCLFQPTQSSLSAIESVEATGNNQIDRTIVTIPWFPLYPTLLVQCRGGGCQPSGLQAATAKAMYFIFVFHSSVWSLIFLFILVAGSLLCLFEVTRPSRMNRRNPTESAEGRLTLMDSYLFVLLPMFLHSHKKFPKSWGGITLALFWYAFALICVIAYAAGTFQRIFLPLKQLESTGKLIVSSRQAIACEIHHPWCDTLANSGVKLTVEPMDFERDSTGNIRIDTNWSSNESRALLVDHVTANQLLYMEAFMDERNNSWRWATARIDCGDASLESTLNLPLIWTSFVTSKSSGAWAMNKRELWLSTSGEKERLMNHWLGNPPKPICLAGNSEVEDMAIRLGQMNGPLVFMICGALSALIAHLAELFYLLFIKADPPTKEPSKQPWEALS